MEANESTSARCSALHVLKAARAITQVYNKALRPSGLRITQMVILRAVERGDSATVTELADQLGMDRTTLSRGLNPLQREGLLQVAVGSDRRTRRVDLSRSGREALQAALLCWQEAQSTVAQALGSEALDGAMAALTDLIRALHQLERGSGMGRHHDGAQGGPYAE